MLADGLSGGANGRGGIVDWASGRKPCIQIREYVYCKTGRLVLASRRNRIAQIRNRY
jgi:hypothetical protein